VLSLVYVSSAAVTFSPPELADILNVSKRNKAAADLTGMLLYVGGNFIQALEGPDQAVLTLYERICRDPRHTQPKTILKLPTRRRQFPEWSMGFRNAESLPADVREQINSFLDETYRNGVPAQQIGVAPALMLLRRFASSMR
jgi:hypothetical protein